VTEPILKRYVTPEEAAILAHRNVRTIRRWMNAQLLTIYKRSDGKTVLDRLELPKVQRAQRHANPVRHAKRLETFAQVAADDLSSRVTGL
jgi:hypothetical protein